MTRKRKVRKRYQEKSNGITEHGRFTGKKIFLPFPFLHFQHRCSRFLLLTKFAKRIETDF